METNTTTLTCTRTELVCYGAAARVVMHVRRIPWWWRQLVHGWKSRTPSTWDDKMKTVCSGTYGTTCWSARGRTFVLQWCGGTNDSGRAACVDVVIRRVYTTTTSSSMTDSSSAVVSFALRCAYSLSGLRAAVCPHSVSVASTAVAAVVVVGTVYSRRGEGMLENDTWHPWLITAVANNLETGTSNIIIIIIIIVVVFLLLCCICCCVLNVPGWGVEGVGDATERTRVFHYAQECWTLQLQLFPYPPMIRRTTENV